jgi:hypothetical protein
MPVVETFSMMANEMGSGMAVCQRCSEWPDVGVNDCSLVDTPCLLL